MLKHKNVIFILFLFLLVMGGCATRLTVVSRTGEPIPQPYYIANAIDNSMKFTWYYVKYEGVSDLDKTTQLIPSYLDRNVPQIFLTKNVKGAEMVLRVFNPNKENYSIINRETIYKNGHKVLVKYIKGASHLAFRKWNFPFTIDDSIQKVTMSVEVVKKENIVVLRTGDFTYLIKRR